MDEQLVLASPEKRQVALAETSAAAMSPIDNSEMEPLDAESYDVVASVLYRDTADAREAIARQHIADAVTEAQELRSEQKNIGTKEQMEAITRTGACQDARFWSIASWCLVLIDAVFWYIATAQLFAF